MNNTVRLDFRLPVEIHERLIASAEASGETKTTVLIRALAQYFSRGNPLDWRNKELQLTPRGDSPVESIMEWLLARRPRVGDMVNASQQVRPELRAAIRRALENPLLGRRVLLRLRGYNYEEIGKMENCSKQAVHQTIHRSLEILSRDEGFVQVLCDLAESPLTPGELFALLREQ